MRTRAASQKYGVMHRVWLMLAAAGMALTVLCIPTRAIAAIAEGTCGTCPWVIDDEGTLTISAGTLANNEEKEVTFWPWSDYRDSITHVIVEEGVIAGDSLHGLFYSCENLKTADVSHLDTSNTTSISGVFNQCSSVTSIDASGWNTSSVTNMRMVFERCSSLGTLDLSSWDTSAVTDMTQMFNRCSSLADLDVSTWNTSSVGSLKLMFYKCSRLETLDISEWNTGSVTNMYSVFADCSSLTSLDVSKWDVSSATDMGYMFDGCTSLTSLDVSEWDTSSAISMTCLFLECYSLESLDVANWNTSSATDISYMFGECDRLTSLDVSKWDVSSVEDMSIMFSGCQSLTEIDVSNWNTSSAIVMYLMFENCTSLRSLDLSSWDVSATEDVSSMFDGCENLVSLDVSGWDTSGFTNIYAMFSDCSRLPSLDLSSWNTSALTNMPYAFSGCSRLASLDLSGWDTSSVDPDAAYGIFEDCDKLAEWTIGSGYVIKTDDMVPEATGDDGKWWSVTDAAWYSREEIIENRSGVADTYKNEEPYVTEWKRLAGKDRYATMAAIAQEGFETSEFAVLATGADFPDALVASSVAGALKAPIILTKPKTLSEDARKELERLGVHTVYIMGGEGAVSSAVEDELKSMGLEVERIAGRSRYDTSAKAMEVVAKVMGGLDTVIVATGSGFADALSAGPWCYKTASPILLAGKDGLLSKDIVRTARELGVKDAFIVGGAAVVSAEAASQLGVSPKRLAGANRYETSRMASRFWLIQGMSTKHVTVTTGGNFPDALAGAALCGSKNAPLLLVKDKDSSSLKIIDENATVKVGYVLGGSGAVSDNLMEYLMTLTK